MITPDTIQSITEQLSTISNHLTLQLSQQATSLRRLGIGLPAGTLDKLQIVQKEVKKLGDRIQEIHTELTQLRALANTSELLNTSLDLDNVLDEAMNRVIQLTRAERGYIMLLDPNTNQLIPRVIRQQDQDEAIILSDTVLRRVLEQGEAVITNNALEDDRFMAEESIVGFALRSIICVPLKAREKIIGAIYCDNRAFISLFGNREKRLLTGFAHQAAIAIENAQYFEQLKDALTEITEIKALLDNILASIASGVITTDGAGAITTFNAAAASIFGIPIEQAVGRWLEQVLECIYPQIRDTLIDVLQNDTNAMIETEVNIDQRGPLNLSLKISPLKDSENQTQGVVLVIDDLTELKHRDKTLAAVRKYLPPVMVDNIKSIEQLALGGERRLVTVMFAEVRPFDTFPRGLGPKALMEWLNTYHTIASEAIHHHAGLIDKYMGNEVMSIFNTQLNPSDNHAWDALQAALRMASDFRTMQLFGTLGEEPTERVYYRIGIHTGIATMGNVGSRGRREFTAIGDTVNLAKRLQENTEMGRIIISRKTLEICQPHLDDKTWIGVRELDAILVKGRGQTTQVFEIFDAGL